MIKSKNKSLIKSKNKSLIKSKKKSINQKKNHQKVQLLKKSENIKNSKITETKKDLLIKKEKKVQNQKIKKNQNKTESRKTQNELIPKNTQIKKIKFYFFENNLTGFKFTFISSLKKKIKGKLHGKIIEKKQNTKCYFSDLEKINGIIHYFNKEGIKYLKIITTNGNVFHFGKDQDFYNCENLQDMISVDIPIRTHLMGIESVFENGKVLTFVLRFFKKDFEISGN